MLRAIWSVVLFAAVVESIVLDCPCEWWRPPECSCALVPSDNATQVHPPSLQCNCKAPRCPCPADQVACESPCMDRCIFDCSKNPRGRDCPDVCSHTCRFACSHNVKKASKLAINKPVAKQASCEPACQPDCALSCTTLRPALSLMRLLVTAEGAEGEGEMCKARCNSSCLQLCAMSRLSSSEKCSSLCDTACMETCAATEVPTTPKKPSVKKACAPLCPDSQDAKEQRKKARAPARHRKPY